MAFIFLAVMIIVACLLNILANHIHKKDSDRNAAFWKRESAANSTRKQDISSLPYLFFDEEAFSFSIRETPRLKEAREQVYAMKGRKMLNLTDLSNTDLKLAYGAANLPALTQYEDNYYTFCHALQNWGEALSEAGYRKEAIQVLQYARLIGSDLSSTSALLTELCRQPQTSEDTQTSFK